MIHVTCTICSPSPHRADNSSLDLLREPLHTLVIASTTTMPRKPECSIMQLVPTLKGACMNVHNFQGHG